MDAHARTNICPILTADTGQVVDTATFPTSPAGLKRADAWIDRRSEPGKTLVAIAGAKSYGAGLTRAGNVKSDIDALAAARTVLGVDVEALLEPRAEGAREALRILLNARSIMERQGTADRLMLTALLRTMDMGVDARRVLTDEQILGISRGRAHREDDLPARIARAEAKRLTAALLQFQVLRDQNKAELEQIVGMMAAGPRNFPGSVRYPRPGCSSPTRTRGRPVRKPHSPYWPGRAPSLPSRATPSGTD
ncbi:MAG: hypothetical protein WCC45_16080 [Paeniglutamicibacter sp.]